MSGDAPLIVSRASVANDGRQPLTVILAPWSREHLLRPGDAVVVEGRGPAGSHAELLVERTCDTAHAARENVRGQVRQAAGFERGRAPQRLALHAWRQIV